MEFQVELKDERMDRLCLLSHLHNKLSNREAGTLVDTLESEETTFV